MSQPRVTITLGRNGGVVQRAACLADERDSDKERLSGKKRPARERLGYNSDSASHHGDQIDAKRQRNQSDQNRSYNHRGNGDTKVDAHDLRYILLRRRSSQRLQSVSGKRSSQRLQSVSGKRSSQRLQSLSGIKCGVRDLREKLSTKTQKQVGNRTFSQTVSLDNNARNIPRQVSTVGGSRPSDQARPDPQVRSVLQAPPAPQSRSAPQAGANPASQQRPINHGQHGVSSGPTNSSHYNTPVKQIAAPAHHPPSTLMKASSSARPVENNSQMATMGSAEVTHKSGCPAGEGVGVVEMSVERLLQTLGLSKYYIIFQAEEVDMAVLRHMRDDDLKEMGIPMGPRKKILLALLSNSRHG